MSEVSTWLPNFFSFIPNGLQPFVQEIQTIIHMMSSFSFSFTSSSSSSSPPPPPPPLPSFSASFSSLSENLSSWFSHTLSHLHSDSRTLPQQNDFSTWTVPKLFRDLNTFLFNVPTPTTTPTTTSTSITVTTAATTTAILVTSVMLTLYLTKRSNTLFRRFQTAEDIHSTKHLKKKPLKLKGYVMSVGDSDGFRFFHTPTFHLFSFWLPNVSSNVFTRQTISVRLAGVDCPEAAHFGQPAQPYSYEAYTFTLSKLLPNHTFTSDSMSMKKYKSGDLSSSTTTSFLSTSLLSTSSFLKEKSTTKQVPNSSVPKKGEPWFSFLFKKNPMSSIKEVKSKFQKVTPPVLPLHQDPKKRKRKVKIEIFRKDQYSRVVAMVYYRPHPILLPFYWKNLSLELLKQGLATIYDQSGAVYGTYLNEFQKAEALAKERKLGIWSGSDLVSPAEWKKVNREQAN